jgi:hypothetical protein
MRIRRRAIRKSLSGFCESKKTGTGGDLIMTTIVLISCVSKKVFAKPGEKILAEKLYDSTLFRLSFAYARKLQTTKIHILSAKHGLLPLEKEIETYNETLNDKSHRERRKRAAKVLKQLREKCATGADKFVILVRKNYYQDLIYHLPNHEMPMEKLPIGKKLQWLKERLCNG